MMWVWTAVITVCSMLVTIGNIRVAVALELQELQARLEAVERDVNQYKSVISSLARQVSVQQFYVEEQTRSTGGSGLKATRLTMTGSRPYHSTSYTGSKIAAIHDHSNYDRTVGMGEISAVLNGIEFKTRHNDYKLRMPSKTSQFYGRTENIPFPAVPPEVLQKSTVEQQIDEMKLWFKAWRDQDFTQRDYRKYFKPILCYLEGMWTESDGNQMDEPFQSDRHFIDADSFFELQDKAKYSSGTGRKSISENYAFLPTTISRISDSGLPVYSQWNYKILCHPLKNDVPLERFRLEDDLGPRVARTKSFEQAKNKRFARFSLWPDLGFSNQFRKMKEGYVSKLTGSYLDELMAEIPGKDNYPGNIVDDAFNNTALKYQHQYHNPSEAMNVAYYHRLYKVSKRDAMGTDTLHRSFSDQNLYVAFNTRSKVTPYQVTSCKKNKQCSPSQEKQGHCKQKYCSLWSHRVSFAIPLEIIYLTPLQSWNPYHLTYYSNSRDPYELRTNNGIRRNGKNTSSLAFYGSSSEVYYRTPSAFFAGEVEGRDLADTVPTGSVSVLDSTGVIRQLRASGIHIILPHIDGVGSLRQRYPIMPLHQSGNAIYKELEALKDVTLRGQLYEKFHQTSYAANNGTFEEVFTFEIGIGDGGIGDHYHTVDITESQLRDLKSGKYVTVLSSASAGHEHEFTLDYRVAQYSGNRTLEHLFIRKCDGKPWQCLDGHKGWSVCNECPGQFPMID